MNKILIRLIVFFAAAMVIFCYFFCFSINNENNNFIYNPIENNGKIYYFGFDLRMSPKEQARIYFPFLEYLKNETGYNFKLKFTPEYEETQESLGKGVTHFAAFGAVSYLKAREKYDVKILVRGLNTKNEAKYKSIIFTRSDSNISSLEDLKGHSFAFGSEDSTQGHLIPRKMLDDAGISLKDLNNYEYTGSHKEAVEAVMSGDFLAGAAQDTLVREIAREGRIKIIKESEYYPSSGIAVNGDVDIDVVRSVEKALINFDPKGKHKDILYNWHKTEMPNGFIKASDVDYEKLFNMMIKYNF